MLKIAFITAAILLPLNVAFAADTMQHDMSKMNADTPASSLAYEKANEKMHADMNVQLTGDADVDFVTGMIPHHQGAVDMANVVLEYGRDPDIRKLAENVIKSQESEIAMMKEWLAKHRQ
jgi:uncharacterized protein (DUF305 family)